MHTPAAAKNSRNLHVDINGGFFHSYQDWEATEMSLRSWTDTDGYIHAKELFGAKKKWASYGTVRREKGNLKCILLTERRQSEEVTYLMVPTMYDITEKAKVWRG